MSSDNALAWWLRQNIRYDDVRILVYYDTPNYNRHYSKIELLERAGYIYKNGDIREKTTDGDKGKLLGEEWTLNKHGARWMVDNWGWYD